MIKKSAANDQFLFGLHYAALFAGVGIVLPYFPRWLEGKGLSPDEVGLILAGAFIGKVVIGPLFSSLADLTGSRKLWLLVLAAGYFLSVAGLHFVAGFWLILIIWGIGGSLATTQIPISDSLSVLSVKQRGLDYGNARLWGSISFIIISMGAGWYLEGKDDHMILVLLTLLSGLAIGVIFLLPNLKAKNKGKASFSLLEAFRITEFRTFIFIAATIQASHAALYGFATIHWSAAGLTEFQIGFLWAEGVVIEVMVFAFGSRLLKRLDIAGLLSIAVAGGLIRWTIMGLTTDLYLLLAIQALHACTFAATHLAVVTYITRRIPDHLSASAQGLYDLLAMGIIFAGLMWLAGYSYALYQGRTFWIMAGFVTVAGLLLARNYRTFKRRQPLTAD